MIISAFKHWEEVVSFDDEASLVGSSSLLSNVYTASLPRTESSNISKLPASHKIGAFDYTQQSAVIGRARKRWTKIFIVIWSSRCVALSKQVRELPRYNNGLINLLLLLLLLLLFKAKEKKHSLHIPLQPMSYIYSYIGVLCDLL